MGFMGDVLVLTKQKNLTGIFSLILSVNFPFSYFQSHGTLPYHYSQTLHPTHSITFTYFFILPTANSSTLSPSLLCFLWPWMNPHELWTSSMSLNQCCLFHFRFTWVWNLVSSLLATFNWHWHPCTSHVGSCWIKMQSFKKFSAFFYHPLSLPLLLFLFYIPSHTHLLKLMISIPSYLVSAGLTHSLPPLSSYHLTLLFCNGLNLDSLACSIISPLSSPSTLNLPSTAQFFFSHALPHGFSSLHLASLTTRSQEITTLQVSNVLLPFHC